MGAPRPLSYRQFIRSLHLLEIYIPVLPTTFGEAFMMFESGQYGYAARPSGRRHTFIHRDFDELVPVLEIQNAIQHLGLNEAIFWNILDHEKVPEKAAAAAIEPQPDTSSTDGPKK